MGKKNPVIKEKKDRDFNVAGLVITLVLIALISVGVFFLSRWFINRSNKSDDTTQVDPKIEEYHDRLLKMLNDNIDKTKLDGEVFASEITTFSYKEKHFYISGYNGSTIYRYDLDLSSKSYSNTEEALKFVYLNEVEGLFDITLDRCSSVESSEFDNRYVTDGISGKHHIAQFGAEQYVYATLLKDEQITLIDGVTLSDTLQADYSPITIDKNNNLYSLYKYIATK